jgi:hypothetical protein|eukprot:SAG25_NODE_651_length_6170_cov_759.229451_1_plen_110_part_00
MPRWGLRRHIVLHGRFHPQLRDKNRRDIGKAQSIWTDSKVETPGSRVARRAHAGVLGQGHNLREVSLRDVQPALRLARAPLRILDSYFMIRTGSAAEISLRFCSFHLRF